MAKQKNKDKSMMCSCGRPLMPCYDINGKRIGVTHTSDDDIWHVEYWQTEKIIERAKLN